MHACLIWKFHLPIQFNYILLSVFWWVTYSIPHRWRIRLCENIKWSPTKRYTNHWLVLCFQWFQCKVSTLLAFSLLLEFPDTVKEIYSCFLHQWHLNYNNIKLLERCSSELNTVIYTYFLPKYPVVLDFRPHRIAIVQLKWCWNFFSLYLVSWWFCRFSCLGREYKYFFWRGNLDIMVRILQLFPFCFPVSFGKFVSQHFHRQWRQPVRNLLENMISEISVRWMQLMCTTIDGASHLFRLVSAMKGGGSFSEVSFFLIHFFFLIFFALVDDIFLIHSLVPTVHPLLLNWIFRLISEFQKY